jgi:4-hydroxybenzoate polyprenyltransferase
VTLSTLKHLRFPFSILLAPVFFFAVSQTASRDWLAAAIVFVVLHLFIYPASNGYNSFYDRDEGAIGGLAKPPPVTNDLLYWSWGLEAIGLGLAFFLDQRFGWMLFVYGVFSKLYSHPRTRIKARPIASWLVVVFFQGAWIYVATSLAMERTSDFVFSKHLVPAIISTLLLAGAYPLTQIFQHDEDARRGDQTLSRLLGVRGTFLFSAICFLIAGISLLTFLAGTDQFQYVFWALGLLAPALAFFAVWYLKVLSDESEASFANTMRMSLLWAFGAIALFTLIWTREVSALEAKLYPLNSNSGDKAAMDFVYRFHSKDRVIEKKTLREAKFETKTGETVAQERVVFGEKGQVEEYVLDHRQQNLVITITKSKGRFEAEISKSGKVTKDSAGAGGSEGTDSEVVLPPLIIERLQRDLTVLERGEKTEFKVLIPDLMQTITFRAQRDRVENGRVVIRLSPANWLISMFAPPPLFFFFDVTTKTVIEAHGQTLLIDEKGKPFFSRTVFEPQSK